jgi:hypothetical protein
MDEAQKNSNRDSVGNVPGSNDCQPQYNSSLAERMKPVRLFIGQPGELFLTKIIKLARPDSTP